MIDWSLEFLQKHIEEICEAERLVTVETTDPLAPIYILVRFPDKKVIRQAEIQYDLAIRRAEKEGLLTEEEMLEIARQRNIWTEKDEETVQEMRSKIENMKEKLNNPDLRDGSKASIQKIIDKLEEGLFKVEKKRENMLINTAERRARHQKYEFMSWACSFDPSTEEKYWTNYLTYCESTNAEVRNQLLGEFLTFISGHTTTEIRYIARSNFWRINYVVAQNTNVPIFPKAVVELTPDQINLLWWTRYYQNIYELLPEDQPDERTIEDDDELDKYMANLHKERSKERQERRTQKKFGGKSAENMKTVLYMQNHPDYYDLDYDKVNPYESKDKTDLTLKDDPEMEGQRMKKSRALKKSKKFKREEG